MKLISVLIELALELMLFNMIASVSAIVIVGFIIYAIIVFFGVVALVGVNWIIEILKNLVNI